MPVVSAAVLEVHASEDGMKLLRFLERRLAEHASGAVLHKWIRTGQVRVNSGRTKPFVRLASGDRVRIPPFAQARELEAEALVAEQRNNPISAMASALREADSGDAACPSEHRHLARTLALGVDVAVVARTPHLLVLAKPAGLACQPGSGQTDSLSARLASAFSGAPFIPAPAHRLDRRTSGLVVAGLTFSAQQKIHALFASGGIRKEYLAWVRGTWAFPFPCFLTDRLIKRSEAGREGMVALPGGMEIPLPPPADSDRSAFQPLKDCLPSSPSCPLDSASGFALSAVLPVQTIAAARLPASGAADNRRSAVKPPFTPDGERHPPDAVFPATLLLLRLFTGRTHQLRVQLASRGFPIIGDGRYAGPHFSQMLLHAFALSVPGEFFSCSGDDSPLPALSVSRAFQAGRKGNRELTVPPVWPARFSPDPALLDAARRRLADTLEGFAVSCNGEEPNAAG